MKQFFKIILIIYLFLNGNLFAQDPFFDKISKLKENSVVPKLTHEQMYQDFDDFVNIIKNCNPQYLVLKELTGYDMVDEIKSYRSQIEKIETTLEFIALMKTVMSCVLEGHCFLGVQVWWHRYGVYENEVALLNLSDEDFGIMFHYRDSVFWVNPPSLKLWYSDKKYFLKYTTTFYTKTDSIILSSGTEILSYKHKPILEFLGKLRTEYSSWDMKNKIFYTNVLQIKDSVSNIMVKTENSTLSFDFYNFKEDERVFDMLKFSKIHTHYFEKDSILYIRLPLMSVHKDTLQTQILKHKTQLLKSVIIDIRENYGGADKTWMSLLGLIGGNPIELHSSILINDDPEVLKRYPDTVGIRNYPMLNTEKPFLVLDDHKEMFEIPENNLEYDGNIYILVDEEIFSSAGGFASMAAQSNRIKTVGIPTGKYTGRGATPTAFKLPYSKLVFILHITLDDACVNVIEDFLHDKVTYPISPSINYYRYYHHPKRSYEVNEDVMYKNDEVFVKALEIIKNEK